MEGGRTYRSRDVREVLSTTTPLEQSELQYWRHSSCQWALELSKPTTHDCQIHSNTILRTQKQWSIHSANPESSNGSCRSGWKIENLDFERPKSAGCGRWASEQPKGSTISPENRNQQNLLPRAKVTDCFLFCCPFPLEKWFKRH